MEIIYTLVKEHEQDPSIVELTQKLTLDKDRPNMGLKGSHGLYGNPQWWDKINIGAIPQKVYEGVIDNVHSSGMNNESKSFTMNLGDGETYTYTCVANNKKDRKLYQAGARVRVVTFQEEMKNGLSQEFVLRIEVGNS